MPRPIERDEAIGQLERLRAAVRASGDLLYDWDLATDRISWFGDAEALFGLSEDRLPQTGDALHSRINPEDLPIRMRCLSDHFAGKSDYDCEFRVRDERGEFNWLHDRGAVALSPVGAPMRMAGCLRLVTSRKVNEARLEYLANYDDLTGHFNKLRLREALDHTLAHAIRFDQVGAFISVGIDQLGMINTAYGFEVGDAVLVEVAQRLDRCLRAADVIGRIGGDRFGIILSNCPADSIKVAAARILHAIRQSPVDANNVCLHITASVGIVMFPSQSKTSFDVMTKAENAMLKAKLAGRDCGQLYELTEEQRRDYRQSMDTGEAVKQAMKDGRLTLAYQPVVSADNGQVEHHECLLRMYEPDGTLVPAGRFIPVVEQLGLMRTLDRRVLDLAIRELELYPDIKLAFNISGLTATDRAWLRAFVARVKDRPELAERVMVEITETAALQDIEESARFVSSVRELGCRVAIDDFGAGYTTFRHLKALTVDVVKIDGSFVRDIHCKAENQLFIRNLVDLASALGLATVAECVENEEDAQALRDQGVDFLQGYLFGKPEVNPPWRQTHRQALASGGSGLKLLALPQGRG